MSYGNRMKKIRKTLKISQKVFSDKLNISVMALSRLETNESSIKVEILLKLNNMGINTNWFITGEGEMFRNGMTIENSIDSDIIKIPLLDVQASAGTGIVNYDENIEEWISVPRILLSHYNPRYVKILAVNGDSMKPTFEHGDWILVSLDHKELQSEQIYVIRINDELKIKRLDKDIRGNIIIFSDNPAFHKEELTQTEFTDFNIEIVGRVFGVLSKV